MATTINNKNIESVRDGFSHFYPDRKADFIEGPYSSGEFSWPDRRRFNEFVFNETKVLIRGDGDAGNIKSAQQVFEKKATTPERVAERTTPEDLKNLEENAARVEAERKKTVADAKETVSRSIEAQQKAKTLKGKVYAKVEVPPKEPTAAEISADEAVEDLKAKKVSYAVDSTAQIIEEKVTPSLKDILSKEDIHNFSLKAAVDLAEAINNPSVVAAYEEASIQDAILFTAANDVNVPDHIRQAAGEIAATRRFPIERSRQFAQAGLGEGFGKFFGRLPSEIAVGISQTPQPGTTHNLDYSKLNDGYGNFLQNQMSFINRFGSMPVDEAKSFLFSQLTKAIDLRISALPANSLIRGLAQNTAVRNGFSLAIGQPISISLGSESWFGGVALRVPGGLKTMNAVGGMFNVSFTTGTAATTGAAEAITAAGAGVGADVAAGAISTGTAEVAAGATGFTLGSLPGLAIGLVVGIVASKPIKDFVSWAQRTIGKNKEYFIGAAVALFGFRLFGLPGAVGGGLFGVLGARALLGGFKGPVRTLKYLGAGLGYVVARSLFRSIVKPLVFIVVAIPIIVAFVLFIINSGAYVVPPSISLGELQGADNPYMLVTKTATPNKIENPPSKATITYTVTIKALKDPLTNITIDSTECNVIKKNKSTIGCPPENIPALDPSLSVSPTSPYTFTFTTDLDGKYSDSLVYDTITVSASTVEKGNVSTSGSASVCVGDCPTDCVKVSDLAQPWPSNLKTNSEIALGRMSSEFQGFMSKVCAKNEEINICYNPARIDPGYYAWHIHGGDGNKCDVYFNSKGVGNDRDAMFLITHELTHHIQDINGSATLQYLASGGWIPEVAGKGFCTYKDTKNSYTESMAEAAGLFASIPSWGSCATNYRSLYPRNYVFAQGFMK